ncbi:MAG: TetR/AcrR family transcriptional regulator [Actinomycetota bacterium]|nr:TetR/AcrR family transcriptional regulator [Actinomycetota bacterium]
MDGRLARGAESRKTTLRRAAELASVDGLGGLTIGRLASELKLSKSGVFASFGSKEELQLATIAYVERVMGETVVEPAMRATPGMPRLRAMLEKWLDHSRDRVFPGGCFLSAVMVEFGAREGRVHDLILRAREQWLHLLVTHIAEAIDHGHLPRNTDLEQLAFELDALVRAANNAAVLTGSDVPYAAARRAMRTRLGWDA